MALEADLKRTENFLGIDFPNAYWAIDDIGITSDREHVYLKLILCAYPNRSSKKISETESPVGSKSFGGSVQYSYNGRLYEFVETVNIDHMDLGNDLTESKLKQIGYNWLKQKFPNEQFKDVFEEGQNYKG